MNDLAALQLGESDEAYLRRRAGEERQQMAETSCMVRSVHEELAEEYEQRLRDAASVTASLEALAAKAEL
jgi:hypothetical protein